VGLTATLAEAGPFTIFAPTNEAFAKANIKGDDTGLPDEALKKVMVTQSKNVKFIFRLSAESARLSNRQFERRHFSRL
jgi:hypothetical protein